MLAEVGLGVGGGGGIWVCVVVWVMWRSRSVFCCWDWKTKDWVLDWVLDLGGGGCGWAEGLAMKALQEESGSLGVGVQELLHGRSCHWWTPGMLLLACFHACAACQCCPLSEGNREGRCRALSQHNGHDRGQGRPARLPCLVWLWRRLPQ